MSGLLLSPDVLDEVAEARGCRVGKVLHQAGESVEEFLEDPKSPEQVGLDKPE